MVGIQLDSIYLQSAWVAHVVAAAGSSLAVWMELYVCPVVSNRHHCWNVVTNQVISCWEQFNFIVLILCLML